MTTACTIAVLTPPGRAAIATIAVQGADATPQVASCFSCASGRSLAEFPLGRIVFGRWAPPGRAIGEELVVCRVRQDLIEVHCHGGAAAIEVITQDLCTRGATVVSWKSWCQGQEPDRIRAEARVALATASTTRVAALLLDQYRGALRQAVEHIARRVTMASVGEPEWEEIRSEVTALLQWENAGWQATRPWRVAFAGRPNAGKSSLLNALAGYQRAIVSEIAGTTRDVVTTTVVLDGWRVELSDTAGHRDNSRDPIEAAGINRAREEWRDADLVLLVIDVTTDWNDADQQLAELLPYALVVHNKTDLVAVSNPRRPEGLAVSAQTGAGVDTLMQAIVSRFLPCAPASGQAIPFAPRHIELLRRALDQIAQHDRDGLQRSLAELLSNQ